jgi:hypothetical protein
MEPRLALNSKVSCLRLLKVGIAGMYHHTQLSKSFFYLSLAGPKAGGFSICIFFFL